jgi:hypothetical protein
MLHCVPICQTTPTNVRLEALTAIKSNETFLCNQPYQSRAKSSASETTYVTIIIISQWWGQLYPEFCTFAPNWCSRVPEKILSVSTIFIIVACFILVSCFALWILKIEVTCNTNPLTSHSYSVHDLFIVSHLMEGQVNFISIYYWAPPELFQELWQKDDNGWKVTLYQVSLEHEMVRVWFIWLEVGAIGEYLVKPKLNLETLIKQKITALHLHNWSSTNVHCWISNVS